MSVIEKDPLLWHKRQGHASPVQLNKLISNELVIGLHKTKFKETRVCETCTLGKQVKSYFKPKKSTSPTRPFELIHMNLCGPKRVKSRGGKRYMFVLVDDYSRYTWPLSLTSKDDAFKAFCSYKKTLK